MVARRAHGAEGAVEIAGGDAAHRLDHRPAGALGRGQAAWRHDGVRVEPHQPLARGGIEDGVDIGLGVDPEQILVVHQGGLAPVEVGFVLQRRDHGGQALGPLDVIEARPVVQHVRMGEEGDGHRYARLLGRSASPV